MQVTHRITIAAPSAAIFRLYEDVPNWHTWDPDTRHASLDGPFQPGSRGRLTPAKGSAVPMILTHVAPGRAFTVECRVPLFRMVFEHVLTPVQGGTEVMHRATFSGPLACLLGRMLARQLRAGLPVTLAKLKARAETTGTA